MSAHGGVVAFVTNSGYVDSASLDGIRLALASEFHYIYVFNLRGNQREGDWRREGGKIFDAGSQAGAAILLLVRKPTAIPTDGGQVQYLDIGDSLTRDEKLRIIADAMPARDGRGPTLGDVKWAHVSPDGTVCVPLRFFDGSDGDGDSEPSLFSTSTPTSGPRHNVTDLAVTRFQVLDSSIEKDDVFFYVYGLLHASDYRKAFAADLKKALPRVPQVSTAEEFWTFARAGRDLANLHTDYETLEPWPGLTRVHASGFRDDHADAYRVLKMKHPKVTDPATGRKVEDRTRIIYNDWITICDIPERAYDYELGSRSAIGWVIDAWRVRTDKASGIVNDPNDWAIEHDDPTYILDLVGRVVTVSMRTLEIVDSLPPLAL